MLREIVLEVGAEGGSLKIVRERNADADWHFWTERNEAALYDALLEEDRGDIGEYSGRTGPFRSLDEALRSIDKYSWIRLHPVEVHSEFLDAVLCEVRTRGDATEEARWREALGLPRTVTAEPIPRPGVRKARRVPVLIPGFRTAEQLFPLQHVSLDKPPYDEGWLQDLIYRNPELVPAGEFDAIFEEITPIAREFPLGSGALDNLYFTPTGYPVLVEVKLWKNDEARRKVVAQILEYAKDFAGLNYKTLSDKIRKVRKDKSWGANPLFEIVNNGNPDSADETEFVDRVARNLREGRFLLLIVGDGVREEMETLAGYLMHHSLRYAFGIVQIRLFTMPDGSVLALPDVMAKTQTIERHVTVVTAHGMDVTVVEDKEVETSISLDGFFRRMGRTSPQNVSWLKGFTESLTGLSIELRVGQNEDSLMLKAALESGDTPTLMYFSPPYVDFWGVLSGKLKKSPEGRGIVRAFLDRVAALAPGASVKVFPKSMDIRVNGGRVSIGALHGREAELREAIGDLIQSANNLQEGS